MKPDLPRFTLLGLTRTVMQSWPAGSICRGYTDKPRSLRRGVATGPLLGGNLSLLCTTLATPYQPEFKGRILFIEDIDERPYRFDRMLTHLLNAGLLQQVAGVAVGKNVSCVDTKAGKTREYRQTVEDVLEERLLQLRIPVVTELPFGHVLKNATLPVGVEARLDGNRGDLVITEAAVE
jgi:muramoyltetrapeptide carboxypeptidase